MDTYDIPIWAACLLINGDIDGCTDEEIEEVREWENNQEYSLHYDPHEDGEKYFSTTPLFGKAAECIQIDVYERIPTVRLKQQLNISKRAIRKQVDEALSYLTDNEAEERGYNRAKTLLDQRGDEYSCKDAYFLIGYYLNSSDDCALDNGVDEHITPLDLHRAEQKQAKYEKAEQLLRSYI